MMQHSLVTLLAVIVLLFTPAKASAEELTPLTLWAPVLSWNIKLGKQATPILVLDSEISDPQAKQSHTQETPVLTFSRWRTNGEVQVRLNLDNNGQPFYDRSFIRTALGYQVTPKWSVFEGVVYQPDGYSAYRREIRPYVASIREDRFKRLQIQNQTRLEQRFFEDSNQVSHRLRHRIRLTHPINAKGDWKVTAYNEQFVTLNTTRSGPRRGWDQARYFVGLRKDVNKYVMLEAGYLFLPVNRAGNQENIRNHIIFLGVQLNN
ncbi:MAG: DUF2490 domain-containing protein [Vampirovibrionales bacterium]